MIYIKHMSLRCLICTYSLLTLSLLMNSYPVSCLELSASTGSCEGSSSLQIGYGAETIDAIDQKIDLDAGQRTISNNLCGTGSLPYSSMSKADARGNYVKVYRSISGKPGVTKWEYEWKTFALYSSSDGYGVGAQLWLDANNAYTISCGSSSSRKVGGGTASETTITSSPDPLSSIVNYYVASTAFANEAKTYQSASAAKGESIQIVSRASDTGGSASAGINCNTDSSIGSSSISNFCSSGTRTKTSATANLKFSSASGLGVSAYLSASNPTRDEARGTANRCQDDKGIVTFSSFCGSSQYTNSYARADIYSLKANLPVGGKMSINMAASTYPSAGLVGKCTVSTSFGGKACLYKYPYDSTKWNSYSFASKSGGVIKAQQSAYGQSYQYASGGVARNSGFTFIAEASKSGYTSARKEAVANNKATKMRSYAQVRLSGAPYVTQG
ncbi:MAG: hypothetical protein PHF94_04615 [Methanothrix sp.]|nr:hypothetical protein [Methanothrix sp.]